LDSNLTPQYWQFWIGMVLVVIVLIGRERMEAWIRAPRDLIAKLGARLMARPAPLGGAAPDSRAGER
jgi:branched-chain amino acid transport system permease protein